MSLANEAQPRAIIVDFGDTDLVDTDPLDQSVFEVNVSDEVSMENVSHNIRRPLQQLVGMPQRPIKQQEVAVVNGGWSLEGTMDELWELYYRGVPIVATNGAARYLVSHKMRPHGHIVLDGLPKSVDFVREEILGCTYFLAAQAHTDMFDLCEDREVIIWHSNCGVDDEQKILLDKYYSGQYQIVPGGSTVGLRSIGLVWLRGFRLIHVFGMDSCYAPDGRHHSFPQEWNDVEDLRDVKGVLSHGGESKAALTFRCSGWQAAQAEQFAKFVKICGAGFRLKMYGDGMLSAMIETGAELSIRSFKED